MDLLEFEPGQLYFDEPLPADAERLLAEAAAAYSNGHAELPLLRAYRVAPRSLSVLVALYRYYYYQHRLEEALQVADQTWRTAGEGIGFPDEWRQLRPAHLAGAVLRSMGQVRFCLTALKAGGYLCLRLGRVAEGRERLSRVRGLDEKDRLGAGALLAMIEPSPQAV